jgi:hypothetical protein
MSGFSRRVALAAGLLALGLALLWGGARAGREHLPIPPPVVPAQAQAPATPTPSPGTTHAMEVMGLMADQATGQPVVILRTKDDKRELMMFIGPFEAQGIALPLQGVKPPRPYTHDLMGDLLRQFNASLLRVVITDLRENTYFARLHLQWQGREIELDSRPSDAIALALREKAPILAEERVLRQTPPPASPPRQNL